MWIVRLALRRPLSFAVMALLMAILGVVAIVQMRKDIFPSIDIPVVSVVWTYAGMPAQEIADRIVTINERAMTTAVNDIEHIESTSYAGVAVIRVFLHPEAKVEAAIAEITALAQTILRPLPPGIFPPAVIAFDASSVPVLQLGLSSDTMSQQDLYDNGQNFIRTQLATVQGASVPLPYGGQSPSVMVDLDPAAMFARGLSAGDVSTALGEQNLIIPAGTAKIGSRDYVVQMNSSPKTVEGLNALPIRSQNGSLVYLRDVAQVRQGHAVQTNIVRQDGRHAVLLTVLKHGGASTLDIVEGVKRQLKETLAGLPKDLKVQQLFDQSIFVRGAMNGVLREAAIAAGLTGLMILLFLGSWRSTLIVCLSIPLSILTSLVVLGLFGQTINVMTLGGLALAVGILVDDATVEIENIHRNLGMKKPLTRAILDGAQQIAVPAFVSTLSICVVFVPVLLLTGAAKYLFTPLAGAVVFAMLTSYLLSRTLVPAMAHWLLGKEIEEHGGGEGGDDGSGKPEAEDAPKREAKESRAAPAGSRFPRLARLLAPLRAASGALSRFQTGFDARFERGRERYRQALEWSLDHRILVTGLFVLLLLASLPLAFAIGRDFFPYVDSGQMRLHVRAPAGLRLEETEQLFAAVEREIRDALPAGELETIVDNIGLPNGSLNLAYGDTATIGAFDGEVLISMKPSHAPTQEIQRTLRERLSSRFPNETFFFQAANITNQILNFGVQSPIDVQVVGRNREKNLEIARAVLSDVKRIPGAVDVHLGQETEAPTVAVEVDRDKARQAGLTQQDVANSMLISLSSSGQIAPTQWLNPNNGVSYQVQVQTPQYRIDSFDALKRTPVTAASAADGTAPQLLGNLATLQRTSSTAVVSHYNVQPVFDIYAEADRRDLGAVASEIENVVERHRKNLPEGTKIEIRGQVKTMEDSFLRLEIGLGFAVLFVYLLMVVNFQSWLDPVIILTAIPGTFCGILWMLFLTQTTFNVPSLMGAIMSIGVATANSILVVLFANDERTDHGADARKAALTAGFTRMRPVVMTALAMILGMLPMALGLGEGGEQNAPLGRAVIGGLLVATLSTLFFVPLMYSWMSRGAPRDRDREIDDEYHAGEKREDGAGKAQGGGAGNDGKPSQTDLAGGGSEPRAAQGGPAAQPA